MADHVNQLLRMAAYFESIGERELAAALRLTATRILDHLCYIKNKGDQP